MFQGDNAGPHTDGTFFSYVKGYLGSLEIARGYILAYRVAAKVIKERGENTFLQSPDFHSGVRADFADSPNGVVKKTRVIS